MKIYFYYDGKERHGPLSFEELKKMNISKDTLIWFKGLDDWKPASELDNMKPILELKPPPINNLEKKSITDSQSGKENIIENTQLELKEASKGWLIAGFFFSLLGGYLGIFIGLYYAFGKYKSETKRNGWMMAILGLICAALWRSFLK